MNIRHLGITDYKLNLDSCLWNLMLPFPVERLARRAAQSSAVSGRACSGRVNGAIGAIGAIVASPAGAEEAASDAISAPARNVANRMRVNS